MIHMILYMEECKGLGGPRRYLLSHKSDPRGEIALRRGRTSATLVDLTLVLWTPGPIRSHREEFLPEGLRAYGRPLYENLMFFIRRRLFYYKAIS